MLQKSKKIGQGCLMVLGILFLVLIVSVSFSDRREPATRATVPTFTPTTQTRVILPTVTPESPTPRPTPTPTPLPAFLARCLDVPTDKIRGIETGLTVGGGGWLDDKTAQAVRSNDYSKVFMIAAAIYGPGMGNGESIGIWASNDLDPALGIIMGVGGFGEEFSDWPKGSVSDAQITYVSDGVREAEDCVRYKQGRH
jgi:hypothetical protein